MTPWDEEADRALEYVVNIPVGLPAVAGGGDISSQLIHHYPLDDANTSTGAGNVKDLVGPGSFNLTLSAAGVTSVSTSALPVTPQFAQGRAMDGALNTSIGNGSGNMFNWNSGSFSVGYWAWITDNTSASPNPALGADQTYFSDDVAGDGTNYFLMHNRSGANAGALVLSCSQGGGGNSLGTTALNLVPNPPAWAHLVYTNNGGGFAGNTTSNAKLYVNGVSTALFTGGAGDNSFLSATDSALGAGTAGGVSGNLAGRIYNVFIFSRVLTQADVTALYNNG